MTSDKLTASARILFGKKWVDSLSHTTGISRLGIGRMAAGKTAVPLDLAETLRSAAELIARRMKIWTRSITLKGYILAREMKK